MPGMPVIPCGSAMEPDQVTAWKQAMAANNQTAPHNARLRNTAALPKSLARLESAFHS